ncbi:hypothetical protein [uncultured Vagococcus sp.]|uniref:hypothetical protein n=1 Tax=uncultured Vagococcus sp. TaxID=189676 RepID=UPI002583C001|nr:hypothetical protein [uncultured Vagococcus sp.]
MLSSIKPIIPEGIGYKKIEKGTEVYHNGAPHVIDSEPYSTYLFVCQHTQFTVEAVSMIKVLEGVQQLPEFEKFDWKNERYVVIHLTIEEGLAGWSLDNSKINNVINHLAHSLFEIDI